MSTTEQTTTVPAGTWTLDPVHSSIGFAVAYSGIGTFRGSFADYDASLRGGRLEGVAKVASVQVDDENLVGHLQTPDFFDAEQHPELRFVSSTIEREGERVTIQGDLTLRGVTTPVEITGTVSGPLENAYGQQRLGFDVETTVNRHDYGISWNMELPGGGQALADDVLITANLALVQEA
ncbi:MAG: YceI family protein [Thermoleophilia bacterium]|nr:YceI family protein [Thermoleophilia bacterium]